jgi:hypothetical protein
MLGVINNLLINPCLNNEGGSLFIDVQLLHDVSRRLLLAFIVGHGCWHHVKDYNMRTSTRRGEGCNSFILVGKLGEFLMSIEVLAKGTISNEEVPGGTPGQSSCWSKLFLPGFLPLHANFKGFKNVTNDAISSNSALDSKC